MLGARGAAAARLAAAASSRDKEFAKGPSLAGSLAPATEASTSAAMRRDALVGHVDVLSKDGASLTMGFTKLT